MYLYYRMTRGQYLIYDFVVALLGAVLIFLQAKCLWNKDAKNLTKSFWAFGCLVGLITIVESCLFVGKG